jgi:hypothetical protein
MSKALAAALVLLWVASARAEPPVVVPPSPAWITISTQELRARYDTIWAVSDVHGWLQSLEQLLIGAGLVMREEGGRPRWLPGRARQLLVVVGDCIDEGPDSVGVVLLLQMLQAQAAAAGSRVIVLLGNHEVDFLAHPRSASRELVSSAERAGVQLSRKRRGEQLAQSEFGHFLRGVPVAAFIGSWLFAHAGYLDAEDDDAALRDYFARLAASWQRTDGEAYRLLRDSRSIVSYHRWWDGSRRRSRMKAHLARLGLDGLVFGHDPGAFGARRTIAMEAGGWLIKLDSGLKTGHSRGLLLRCEVQRLSRGAGLAMHENGKPTCRAMTPDGALHDLPVK